MARSQSGLSDLLDAFRAGAGVDLVRDAVGMVMQELIETEATDQTATARCERITTRVTERNGSRPRLVATQAVDIAWRIPKLRKGSFSPNEASVIRHVGAVLATPTTHGKPATAAISPKARWPRPPPSAILAPSPSPTPATDTANHREVHHANGHSLAAQEGAMRQALLTGLERLTAVTALLHRIRLKEPRGGVWEAADLQWWWRRPRGSDEVALPVWFDEADQPIAAAVLTEWPHAWWLDLIRLPGLTLPLDDLARPAWAHLEGREGSPVIESLVPADDGELGAWFAGRGFAVAGASWSGWQAAADRPAVAALPTGYQLVDRAVRGADGAPGHPMVVRNGPDVEARLRQTTLYDPRLDLAVLAPDGSVAGYSLFWYDPVTGVGLVEPVRVEDEHAGRGIGYAMISAGLDRLARAGATTLKIGWESDRAGALYTRLGFASKQTLTTYRLAPPGQG